MTAGARGVLNNLVTQFASPFDAMRELVQNSIDAGTSQVDVWVDFETGPGGAGVIAIHVDDYGEGMNEAIIDQQFTKLFASDKEGDLTKIGKFGIGFVSVFALEPEAVLVHTGRGGEYWEVLFHKNRSFSKTRLDVPLEGTQITIFLSGTPAKAQAVAAKVHASLKKWCVYAETEITFENRIDPHGEVITINERFAVEGDFPVSVTFEDETEIAVAFSNVSLYAFYNRGLTLAHSDVAEQIFPTGLVNRVFGRSIKIKSRYLEHTLSRDSVVRDANYNKTMTRLSNVLSVDVPRRLIKKIEQIATNDTPTSQEVRHYERAISLLNGSSYDLRTVAEKPILLGFDGKRYTPKEIVRAFRQSGHIFVAEQPTDVVDRLIQNDVPVLMASAGHGVRQGLASILHAASRTTIWGLLRWALGFNSDLFGAFVHPDRVYREIEKQEAEPTLQHLLDDVIGVIQEFLPWFETFVPATVIPQKLGAGFIFFEHGGEQFAFISGVSTASHNPLRYLNIEHPHVQDILAIYPDRRALAVYALARVFMLQNETWVHHHKTLMDVVRRRFDSPNVGKT